MIDTTLLRNCFTTLIILHMSTPFLGKNMIVYWTGDVIQDITIWVIELVAIILLNLDELGSD